MSDLKPTPIAEQQMVGKAVLMILSQNKDYKDLLGLKKVSFNYLDKDCDVGMFPLPGASILRQNIIGGYTAQYPFAIFIKDTAPSDVKRMALSDLADTLCNYLTRNKDAISLTDGRKVDRVEQTSLTTLVERVGTVDTYRVSLNLVYKL